MTQLTPSLAGILVGLIAVSMGFALHIITERNWSRSYYGKNKSVKMKYSHFISLYATTGGNRISINNSLHPFAALYEMRSSGSIFTHNDKIVVIYFSLIDSVRYMIFRKSKKHMEINTKHQKLVKEFKENLILDLEESNK